MRIVSTFGTIWTGSFFDSDAIERAVATANQRGKAPYLHVEFQQMLNNGVEDPSRPFRHDWRLSNAGRATMAIKPGWAGSRNALAQCLIGKIHADEGSISYPCYFAVSCSPDGYDVPKMD